MQLMAAMGALTLFRQVKIKILSMLMIKKLKKVLLNMEINFHSCNCLSGSSSCFKLDSTWRCHRFRYFINCGINRRLLIIKPKLSYTLYDSDRLTQQVGTTGILPQFLVALGVLFTASGVGQVISKGISSFYLKATI